MNLTQARAILGVNTGATVADIKQAFRRAARQHHPDKGGNAVDFQAARAAHDALIDALSNPNAHAIHIRRTARNPGINITVSVDPADLFADYTTHINVVAAGHQLLRAITIPRWCQHNQRITYHGLGLELTQHAPPGDIVVTVLHSPASRWHVVDRELHTTVDICVFDAIIGTTTRIAHPSGAKIDVVVPPGSVNGSRLRVANYGFGDNQPMIVTLRARVPPLTAEQTQQLQSFKLSL